MMKKESAITRYLVLIFLGLLEISIIVIFPMFLTSELDNQTHSLLKEISEKNGESIGFRFEEQASHVYHLVREVDRTKLLNPKEAVESIDESSLHGDSFIRYGISTLDGNAYTSDGKTFVIANDEHIKKCVAENNLTISRIRAEDSIDGNEVITMHYPLKHNQEVQAVLFLTFSVEQMMDTFESSAFNRSEFFYVVDVNGNNIMSNNKNETFRDVENIFYGLPDDVSTDGKMIEKIQANMNKGECDTIVSRIAGDYYLYYAPLGFNGWYLFSLLPSNVVNGSRNAVLSYVALMCFFLITVSIFFTVYSVSTERRKKYELDKILYTDALTGGASYAKFCLDVKKQLVKKHKAAYIVMDLDNFKLINDRYGYDMGNRTIKYVNSLWQGLLRDDEFVGRIVADRFAVYLRYSSEKDLMNRLKKFCQNCRTFNSKDMSDYILVPSIGVYYIKDKNSDIQKMQNCAVMAKSIIKGDRDSMISVYSSKIKNDLIQQKLFHDELERAIKNDELTVVLQPQYTANDSKICSAEMLVRWKKADGTFVPPSEFVPVAEEKGLVKNIDRFVFRRACIAQKDLSDKGFPLNISVNLSQQSLYDSNLIKTYLDIAKETNADINHIHIEVTETTLFSNNKAFTKILQNLHKAGFKILLDDFGTGYSSFMLLKSMPIDCLKLDKTFIDDFENPRGQRIIECVIEMAKRLGITIVAEGIETAEQFQYIKHQNCDMVQGFHFSHPLEYEKFCSVIENSK